MKHDVKRLKELDAAGEAPPWEHDGGGGLTLSDDFDAHLVDDSRHGDLVVAARNALPAFLRFVEAMHDWDSAMQAFDREQRAMEQRGERIPMDWALERTRDAQEKLDAATAILRAEFDFGGEV